ncbi:MAG: pilus assembly protein PilM [Deltaproteobacteria bacterium]|nr:pilus assembly protein PilM [Deltaproteobacteria bacterium]
MLGLPFFKKKDVVALDIGSSSIKLAELKQAKKGWELLKLGITYLPPEAIVDGSIIDSMTVKDAITELLKSQGIAATEAVSALTGHSVIIKRVSMPAMTEADLSEQIQWEAEQYIPFPMSDVNIDFQILGEDTEGSGQMDVMLVAVKKDVINDYVNVIREAGLNPVIMDVDSFAIENMMEIGYSFAPNENVAIVNIGASITTISVISGGKTIFTRSNPTGGNQFTEEIQRNMNVNFKEAEDIKTGKAEGSVPRAELPGVMERVSGGMAMDIRRSLDFFLAGNPGMVINKILLCGGGAMTIGLKEVIQEKAALPVETINPFSGINANPKKFNAEELEQMAPYFGVAIGLATRRLGDR